MVPNKAGKIDVAVIVFIHSLFRRFPQHILIESGPCGGSIPYRGLRTNFVVKEACEDSPTQIV